MFAFAFSTVFVQHRVCVCIIFVTNEPWYVKSECVAFIFFGTFQLQCKNVPGIECWFVCLNL